MTNPLVTINVVVLNGERYIRECLTAVRAQTHDNLEVNIFDNNSADRTREIVQKEFPEFNLIAHYTNLSMWGGQEESLKYSHGKYVVALSVDVMLHREFIEKAVTIGEDDHRIGAIQAKIYSYEYDQLADGSYHASRTIDTCGFRVERSRRVTNIGHGQHDSDEFVHAGEVFAVEGAVPFFRREALDSIRVDGEIVDHDFFWYGDDVDFGWRMRLFGWKQWFDPDVRAYHDRSTTKGLSHNFSDYLRRVKIRQQIPQRKRILDARNIWFTIVKNDYIINILRDLPFILVRQALTFGYWLLFEPKTFAAVPQFFQLLPKMLRKRKLIMERAKATPSEIHRWIR